VTQPGEIRRGEVRWADLGQPVGSGPGLRRPVVVVSADRFNRSRIATVMVAAVTSNLRLADAPGNVLIEPPDSGLPRTSVINVSQLATLDKAVLTDPIGTLRSPVLRRVEAGLRLVLDL
jgi:mRNA interferase MazF